MCAYEGIEVTRADLAVGHFPVNSVYAKTAQLPSSEQNQDRIIAGRTAVAVLDGASTDEPSALDAATHAEALGTAISSESTASPTST